MGSTEAYVVDLLENLLGRADKGKRFEWCRGDVSSRTGRAALLPFDAVWENLRLIVEVDEDQHTEATPLFDRRMTVSGVHRGEQRRRYDALKRAAARAQGYKVVAIPWSRRRKRSETDSEWLRVFLEREGVVITVVPVH